GQLIDLVELPGPARDCEGMWRELGHFRMLFEREAGEIFDRAVHRATGQLQQTSSTKPVSITAGSIAVAHAVRIDEIPQLFRIPSVLPCDVHVRKTAWPHLHQARRRVAQILHLDPETTRFVADLTEEVSNPLRRIDAELGQAILVVEDVCDNGRVGVMSRHRFDCFRKFWMNWHWSPPMSHRWTSPAESTLYGTPPNGHCVTPLCGLPRTRPFG